MDPLDAIISLLRPAAALSKPITARGAWGVRYSAYERPGFALILEGSCWLTLAGKRPLRLDQGDFVLLPATPAFEMASHPDGRCDPVEPSDRPMRHGEPDGAPDFRMLGGSFRIEGANASLLVALLPDLIHVRAASAPTRRLSRIVDLIMEEAAIERPGGGAVVKRLLDVMLIEALRHEVVGESPFQPGLLAGLRDAGLARALCAIHAAVGDRWTVDRLARHAGMSRSAFAARFMETVGCAPIEYLSRWRMALAKDSLGRGGTSLDRLAAEIGYESASAFSTAFRRRVGCAPGAFGRMHREGGSAA